MNIDDFEKKCTIGRGHYGEVSVNALYILYTLYALFLTLYNIGCCLSCMFWVVAIIQYCLYACYV